MCRGLAWHGLADHTVLLCFVGLRTVTVLEQGFGQLEDHIGILGSSQFLEIRNLDFLNVESPSFQMSLYGVMVDE